MRRLTQLTASPPENAEDAYQGLNVQAQNVMRTKKTSTPPPGPRPTTRLAIEAKHLDTRKIPKEEQVADCHLHAQLASAHFALVAGDAFCTSGQPQCKIASDVDADKASHTHTYIITHKKCSLRTHPQGIAGRDICFQREFTKLGQLLNRDSNDLHGGKSPLTLLPRCQYWLCGSKAQSSAFGLPRDRLKRRVLLFGGMSHPCVEVYPGVVKKWNPGQANNCHHELLASLANYVAHIPNFAVRDIARHQVLKELPTGRAELIRAFSL